MSSPLRLLIVTMLIWASICASACAGNPPHQGFDATLGTGPVDGGDARVNDGATGDAHDAGACRCAPFEYCSGDRCVPYEGCLSDAGCPDGQICRNLRCIPSDHDPDGDGFTADVDCDESRGDINPGAAERCNSLDDDCNGEVDDGPPGLLCADDPAGGECHDGVCGCLEGWFDIDSDPINGCECAASPSIGEGESCDGAIDMGEVSDVGQSTRFTGNVLPDDRGTWLRFRAIDTADLTCDNFHVRVQLVENPADAFAFTVRMGDCRTEHCDAGGYADYSWATDFRNAEGLGECPCAPAPGRPGENHCSDNSNDFWVGIRRRPGVPISCAPYVLEISNGIYDS